MKKILLIISFLSIAAISFATTYTPGLVDGKWQTISYIDTILVSLGNATLDDIGTPASDDKVLIKDTSDSGALKYVDWSDIGGGGASQLSDLSDVGVTTATNRNALMADGDSWESRAIVEADISDLGSYLENIVEDSSPQLGGDLDANSHTITNLDASDTAKGIVELATTAETTTGTDATRAVTPDGLEDGFNGSTNITTLGTIATGIWNGTAIEGSAIASTGESGGTKYLREDGDGTCSWQTVAGGSSAYPPGYIAGLVVTVGTDTEHDIDISTGSLRLSGDAADYDLESALTKQIDAAWSVGDDAGGLDTGTVASDTMYYIWAIRRSDTGVEDILISASATSPTMPTDYDQKSWIWFLVTDGSANIVAFTSSPAAGLAGKMMRYDYFQRNEIASGLTEASLTEQSVAVSVPSAVSGAVQSVLFGAIGTGAGDANVIISSNDTSANCTFQGDTAYNAVGLYNEHYTFTSASPVFIPISGSSVWYETSGGDTITLYARAIMINRNP
jgi:hypothetical protein